MSALSVEDLKVSYGDIHAVKGISFEVRDGEVLSKQPDDTLVNNGDLDSGRDFEITVRRAAR